MSGPYATAAEERERLILEYLPKVRWIAAGIHERLPRGVSQEDLVSTGIVGLINAIDSFDPSRKAALWTYAEYKIRGAMLDSIKGLDGVAAHKRKNLKPLQDAIAAVEQRTGRAATEEEAAAELSLPLDEYRRMLLELQGITLDSLDGPNHSAYYVADAHALNPAAAAEQSELQGRLAKAIARLPQNEAVVLHLYFAEELTLMEIAEVVSLHYSRVSQLKTQAILRLRSYLGNK